ncbi:MAG: 4-(cytidine 5'-diphospho)-2-C-methyl-D-erythritol kinase [Bacteroidales bacterium]|nr:4-(cytidine 5'-diphospho)-2-C-methyl-D-erythritol kinase [Bacteroidales bacterium]
MICFPNCKINLGLSVTEKRPDGFHNVETIMFPLPMFDVLEIIMSSENKTSFTTTGLNIGKDWENNLVYKAYKLLEQDFDLNNVNIHLHKVVPSGAGLGGGSSDAAYTIKLLNDLFNLKLSIDQMQNYAAMLGSDCAFFIKNKPVFAFGKGDRFKNIDIDLSGYHFVVVKPNIHIATPEAYSWITPKIKKTSLKEIIHLPVGNWKDILINDFEKKVFKRHPEIKEIRDELYEHGAVYASMTGSGAAVYGIFEDQVKMKGKFNNHFVWTSY